MITPPLQLDAAPGHMSAIIRRIVAESGRIAIMTPAGTSGYSQPCDNLPNAALQSGFLKVTNKSVRKIASFQLLTYS